MGLRPALQTILCLTLFVFGAIAPLAEQTMLGHQAPVPSILNLTSIRPRSSSPVSVGFGLDPQRHRDHGGIRFWVEGGGAEKFHVKQSD